MKLEELLEILDIEGPEEFAYFENFADLIEYEEKIPFDALYSLIKQVNMVSLGEFIEIYFDDILEGIPEEDGIDAYTFLTSVKMMLLGLAESIATAEEDEERDEMPVFVEELYKFRNWFKSESVVEMTRLKDNQVFKVNLFEAITAYRIEKLNQEEYSYSFDECVPYEIDEYMVSFASAMADIEDEEEEEDDFSGNDEEEFEE